jgi:hypothetical protein
MAKITTINDFPLYARMVAEFLREQAGHEVQMLLSPVLYAEIEQFGPVVIIISIVRKIETIGHGPMHDFYTEVDGAKSFRDLAQSPSTGTIPIVLASLGVKESEVPKDLKFAAFVHIPQEMDLLLTVIANLVKAQESGSGFAGS